MLRGPGRAALGCYKQVRKVTSNIHKPQGHHASAQRPPTDVSDGHGLATAPINKILTKTPVTPRGLSLSLSHCH